MSHTVFYESYQVLPGMSHTLPNIGVSLTRSQLSTIIVPLFLSIFSILTRDSPIGEGRYGARDAKIPTFFPPALGGATFDFFPLLLGSFRWKWNKSQQWEYCSSPSRTSFGIQRCFIFPLSLPVSPWVSSTVDVVFSRPGWCGVPHFVKKSDLIIPIRPATIFEYFIFSSKISSFEIFIFFFSGGIPNSPDSISFFSTRLILPCSIIRSTFPILWR